MSALAIVAGLLIAGYLSRARQPLPPEALEDIAILKVAICIFVAGGIIFGIWS